MVLTDLEEEDDNDDFAVLTFPLALVDVSIAVVVAVVGELVWICALTGISLSVFRYHSSSPFKKKKAITRSACNLYTNDGNCATPWQPNYR